MFTRLDTLQEAGFVFFRIPFKSRRQTPTQITKGLMVGILLQAFLGLAQFYIFKNPLFDLGLLLKSMLLVSICVTVVIIILSIIFAIPNVYQNRQHVQYMIMSLMLQNFAGLSFYTIGLYVLRIELFISKFALSIFIIISILFAFALMSFAFIRLTRSILRGDFSVDSGKHDHEKVLALESKRKPAHFEAVLGIAGVVLAVVVMLHKILPMADVHMIFAATLFLSLPFIVLYMFSYSLVIYYCKKRFTSFNFDEEENLYPLGSGDNETGY